MRGTALIRLRRAVALHGRDGRSESGFAMLTAIMFMIIIAGVTTVILGVVLGQVAPGNNAQKNTKTIYSAQAGLQAALGIFRNAGTANIQGTVYGDTTKLPCSLSSTATNATTDGNAYSVAIAYYASDPTVAGATAISCTTGAYGAPGSGPVSTPAYAVVTSTGSSTQIPNTSGIANRVVSAIYKFQVVNNNVPGGRVLNNGATSCMQAVSASAGSLITFVAGSSCVTSPTNDALQLWSYSTNYQLQLSSTTAGGLPGLCITGPVLAGQPTQNATLQACAAAGDPARWNQLWSWTGNYTWEGENQAINGPNGSSWLSAGVPDGTSAVGQYLQVATSVNGTMAPTSQVGAGAAKYTTHQMVNYLEFGRCADVTGENINATAMISYPCKQDPTGSTTYITWNQKWYYCEVGDPTCDGTGPGKINTALPQKIYVNYLDNTSAQYCLTTPLAGSGSIFPTFLPCATSGPTAAQQGWTRIYNVPGNYYGSYIFTDEYGHCLGANANYPFATGISELTALTCTGSDAQKWNAPPNTGTTTVGGYKEISG
jgi:Tfp pilus assembly protein PilX